MINNHLAILSDIRLKLIQHTDPAFLPLLKQPFTIVEETTKDNKQLGHCVCEHTDWTLINPITKRAKTNITTEVHVRLQVPLSVCILTFLHELAHVITPGELIKVNDRWRYNPHSNLFYDNFASILRTAEKLRIFILPPVPNKYSRRMLERYDNMDTDTISPPPSTIPLYCKTKLEVLISTTRKGKNIRKSLKIEPKTVQDLLKLANKRLNIKAKTIRLAQYPSPVLTDDMVLELTDGTELVCI